MKTKLVNETLNEFIEDIENPIIPEEIELSAEDELEMQDEFESALKNELNVPEHARRTISFRIKGDSEIIDAVPMARLKDGSFLMKIGDKFKKFNMSDIIEESFKIKEKSKLNEGSYDDFLMNYGTEIKNSLSILRKIQKKIENNEINEETYESAFERAYQIYDESVISWIEHSLRPNSYTDTNELVSMALDNMNETGTEMQMVLQAIDEIGSKFGIYNDETYESFYPTSSFFRDLEYEEEKDEEEKDEEENEEDEENINLVDLITHKKSIPRISTTK